jgi:sulfotransferase family protein
MKAGTTTLFDHLAGHPAVAASSDKEPKYFARDHVYAQGPEWYATLWDWDPSTHAIAMEASTHYSFRHIHPDTAARMAAHPGEFRLVYLVREPVARVESHYHHALAAGWKVADHPLGVDLHRDLVEPCRYAWQLDAFAAQFPRSSILVLNFEDLVAEPEATVERVLAHWDLPADGLALDTDLVRNSSSAKVVSTRVHSARRVPGSTWLAERLSPTTRRRIKSLIGSGTEAPRLDAATCAALRAELAEDHARLADEWGVDVSGWQPAD